MIKGKPTLNHSKHVPIRIGNPWILEVSMMENVNPKINAMGCGFCRAWVLSQS
jgi:hypothetical protein